VQNGTGVEEHESARRPPSPDGALTIPNRLRDSSRKTGVSTTSGATTAGAPRIAGDGVAVAAGAAAARCSSHVETTRIISAGNDCVVRIEHHAGVSRHAPLLDPRIERPQPLGESRVGREIIAIQNQYIGSWTALQSGKIQRGNRGLSLGGQEEPGGLLVSGIRLEAGGRRGKTRHGLEHPLLRSQAFPASTGTMATSAPTSSRLRGRKGRQRGTEAHTSRQMRSTPVAFRRHSSRSSERSLRTLPSGGVAACRPAVRLGRPATRPGGTPTTPAAGEAWRRQRSTGVECLRNATGVERICLLGVRLGASLAALAARSATTSGRSWPSCPCWPERPGSGSSGCSRP